MIKEMLDPNGKKSSVRAVMFMCVGTGCAVALMGAYAAMQPGATIDLIQVAALSGSVMAVGVGGKVAQKGKEQTDA